MKIILNFGWISLLFIGSILNIKILNAQNIRNNPTSNHANDFEQLGTILPTPNNYRTASGAPGANYWQQKADYDITCELDEETQKLSGEEKITYTNNSPDALEYLWLQLDENQHNPTNDINLSFNESKIGKRESNVSLENLEDPAKRLNGTGVNIESITDEKGKPLAYTINRTMMRIDLPSALASKGKISFKVKWNYKLIERKKVENARGGYEYFPEDKNYLFTIVQWYPRMCVYSDFQGWQNKQFTGKAEFALNFGDFKVSMKVPADHVVGATGVCTNYKSVLSTIQMKRWTEAQIAKEPIEIVSLKEAEEAEKNKSKEKKTWTFEAKNVRDFAWTSSRKFVWDAMPTTVGANKVMCMSFYGKEAYNLYRKYSTKTVAHALQVYSRHTIDYPYPVAQSVEADNGMEYPMICFNYGRTAKDGTYSEEVKYEMIGVIIHEVGHNFFPMILNTDERQWTWIDEGFNSFIEAIAKKEFDNNFPFDRATPQNIRKYLSLPKDQLEPIMTNSDQIVRFGNNPYQKTGVALTILRETILGRDIFDHAFKTYAKRWAFKHPTPADFFRTMEDASGTDLDWFWRTWFYDIKPVDIAIDSVTWYKIDMEKDAELTKEELEKKSKPISPTMDITYARNAKSNKNFLVDRDTTLRDFYYYYKAWKTADSVIVTKVDPLEKLSKEEKEALSKKNYYELYFSNKGGAVMPIIIQWNYKDGSKEETRIPAEIWRKNESRVVKVFVKEKEVASIQLDPMKETTDIDEKNNVAKTSDKPAKILVYKEKDNTIRPSSANKNLMQLRMKK